MHLKVEVLQVLFVFRVVFATLPMMWRGSLQYGNNLYSLAKCPSDMSNICNNWTIPEGIGQPLCDSLLAFWPIHTLKKLSKGALWGINLRQLPLPLDNLLHLSSRKIATFEILFLPKFLVEKIYHYRFGRWCSRPASSPWWRSDRWRRIEEDLWQSSGRSWSQRGRQFGVPFWENSCSNEDARNLKNALGKGYKWPAKEERVCGGEEDDHNGQVVLSRVMVGEMDYLRNALKLFILREQEENDKRSNSSAARRHWIRRIGTMRTWCQKLYFVRQCHFNALHDERKDDDDNWWWWWWLAMMMEQMLMMSHQEAGH